MWVLRPAAFEGPGGAEHGLFVPVLAHEHHADGKSLGEGAGDILQILSLAMANKLKMRDLTKYISPYPTRAEIVKRAASLYFQPTVFGPMMKKLVSITQRIP